MTINNDYDIMIAGGGLAGISTYLHLYKYAPELAERTLLVEQEHYPREKLCGGAVGGWSEQVLTHLGIKLNINSLMIDTVECRFKNKEFILHEPGYFRMVHRKEFDHLLVNEALIRGLNLHEGEEFLDFNRENNTLIVETNQDKYKIKALVGADGSLSKVRKKINKSSRGNLASTLEIFSSINPTFDTEYETKKVVFDFSPIHEGLQGYVWHFPCIKENQPFMNHGIVNFRIHKYPPDRHMKMIFTDELTKRKIDTKKLVLLSHPIRCLSKNDVLSTSNVLLVGDAAGIEPATGGGIHLALSYGEIAANSLLKSFKSHDFTFNDYRFEFEHSLAGRYIQKLSHLAQSMYNQKTNPLEHIKQIFIKNKRLFPTNYRTNRYRRHKAFLKSQFKEKDE